MTAAAFEHDPEARCVGCGEWAAVSDVHGWDGIGGCCEGGPNDPRERGGSDG